MPTDLPYAAEAESSLSYDELEVSFLFRTSTLRLFRSLSRKRSHARVQRADEYGVLI